MQLHLLLLKFHENWSKVKFASSNSDIISITEIHQKALKFRDGVAT